MDAPKVVFMGVPEPFRLSSTWWQTRDALPPLLEIASYSEQSRVEGDVEIRNKRNSNFKSRS